MKECIEYLDDIEAKMRRLSTGSNVHIVNNIIQQLRCGKYFVEVSFLSKAKREDLICKSMTRFNGLVQEFHHSMDKNSDLGEVVSKKEFRSLVKSFEKLLTSQIIMLIFTFFNLDCNDCAKCVNKKICDSIRSVVHTGEEADG